MPEQLFDTGRDPRTPDDPRDIRVDQKKEVILHRGALRALARIGSDIFCQSDVSVTRSHMLRALCQILEAYEPEILEQIRAASFDGRPPNGEHADLRRYLFERQIAAAVSRAIVLTGPMDPAGGLTRERSAPRAAS